MKFVEETGVTIKPRKKSVKKSRRRRRSKEEILADRKRLATRLRKQGAASFRQERAQAHRVGSRLYIWRSAGDSDVCPACAASDGKRFDWNVSPPHGHPGEAECITNGYCRCYAEAVLP
ncbi:MAG: hypothetical protein KGM97_06725 [Alphaproteobacteria bacterium]|nr:hypothetical protein [Alphaproteobacteria bacterium]MDE2630668.1 hypothetical protein [Alphaproteobacteria bacterium]